MGKKLNKFFFFGFIFFEFGFQEVFLGFAMSFEKIWKGMATQVYQVSFEIFFWTSTP